MRGTNGRTGCAQESLLLFEWVYGTSYTKICLTSAFILPAWRRARGNSPTFDSRGLWSTTIVIIGDMFFSSGIYRARSSSYLFNCVFLPWTYVRMITLPHWPPREIHLISWAFCFDWIAKVIIDYYLPEFWGCNVRAIDTGKIGRYRRTPW